MSGSGSAHNENDGITPGGRVFLVAFGLALSLLLASVGWTMAASQRRNALAAEERHRARLDPAAADSGTTPPDLSLPRGSDPTKVAVGLYVDRIIELSIKDSTWTADFYVWFRWRGDRIASCEEFQVIDGTIESKEREVEHTQGDDHYERYRVLAKITKSFDISRFPCDDHQLLIHLEIPAHPRHELLFVADTENSGVSSRVRAAAYAVHDGKILEKPHSYKTTRGDPRLAPGAKSTYSQCRMGIAIRRSSGGYYLKLFQSLYVAVAIAMLALFIKPTNVDPRFGLGVGGLFAAVANSYISASVVPDTGVMTLADAVNGVGIGVILLTVLQSTLSLYLFERRGAEALSRRFDQLCFIILSTAYIVLNIALPWTAGLGG